MDQRIKKIKLFRTLKVVYYCLGMPLFLLAVMTLASQLYGHWPFSGNGGTGLFDAIKAFFNSPAMYSVWIALGIWLVIGLVQIVCNFAIKNRHSRMLIVVAVMLVILLVPIFVIDAIYDAKVDALREEYGIGEATKVDANADGLIIKDYSEQLSYYHVHTGDSGNANNKRVSLTDTLIANATGFCTYYNIPFYGTAKLSAANNFTNQALYYDDLGFDYDGSGAVDEYDHIMVSSPFNTETYADNADKDGRYWFTSITLKSKDGSQTATVEGNFYCKVYTQAVPTTFGSSETKNIMSYVWYDGDKGSFEATDGVYGSAYYNKNGLLSDGYVYDINVALRILEDYYSAQEEMTAAYKAYTAANGSSATEAAIIAYVNDNKAEGADDVTTLEEKHIQNAILAGEDAEYSAAYRLKDRYTNSSNENYTEADNKLYDAENALLANYSLTAAELTNILGVLGSEIGSTTLLSTLLGTLGTIGVSLSFTVPDILGLVGLSAEVGDFAAGLLNMKATTLAIGWYSEGESDPGHLRVTFNGGVFATPVYLDLDATFSLSQLEPVLAAVGISPSMLGEVLGLLGLGAEGDDINELISNVLQSLYWYSSPVLAPAFDFYADESLNQETSSAKDKALYAYQVAFAKYSRAKYEGGAHGYMVGSRLIGDSIGDGSFAEANGLTSLVAVKQLQVDLSYQPEMYSVLIVRDMLMTFAAIILFFTIMSYIAADREILYATGKIELKSKKSKKSKEEDAEIPEDTLPEEETPAPVEEKSEEEVR